ASGQHRIYAERSATHLLNDTPEAGVRSLPPSSPATELIAGSGRMTVGPAEDGHRIAPIGRIGPATAHEVRAGHGAHSRRSPAGASSPAPPRGRSAAVRRGGRPACPGELRRKPADRAVPG